MSSTRLDAVANFSAFKVLSRSNFFRTHQLLFQLCGIGHGEARYFSRTLSTFAFLFNQNFTGLTPVIVACFLALMLSTWLVLLALVLAERNRVSAGLSLSSYQ